MPGREVSDKIFKSPRELIKELETEYQEDAHRNPEDIHPKHPDDR